MRKFMILAALIASTSIANAQSGTFAPKNPTLKQQQMVADMADQAELPAFVRCMKTAQRANKPIKYTTCYAEFSELGLAGYMSDAMQRWALRQR